MSEFRGPDRPGTPRTAETMDKRLILIAGPTACGKSALALRLAEVINGEIINADSMQVYRELRVVTARPSPAEEACRPHRLYGVWMAGEAGSAGRWRRAALAAIEAAHAASRVPILVGGTGLYFMALTEGLARVPQVSEAVRRAARARLAADGAAGIHAELAERDPETAARVPASDPQRLLRALEVLEATGRPLSAWRREPTPPLGLPWLGLTLDMPRDTLYGRIERRFDGMLADGVMDEVRAFHALALSPELPVMKAVGLRELMAHVAGEVDLGSAVAGAKQASRRYAKRQMTWQRNKMHAWNAITAQESESFYDKTFSIVSRFLLTDSR